MNTKAKQRNPLFSVTAQDCDWSYTRGTGAGGQKKIKLLQQFIAHIVPVEHTVTVKHHVVK